MNKKTLLPLLVIALISVLIMGDEAFAEIPTCEANPRHDFGKCKKNTEEPPNTFEQVKAHCNDGGDDVFLEWWDDDVYYNNAECQILDREKPGPPPPHSEPAPIPEPKSPHTANELDELCRTNQALCLPPIRSEIPVEDVCGPNMKFVDAICTPDCHEGSFYEDGVCQVENYDNNFSTYMALLIYSMIPVWFAISGVYLAFGKKHRKLIPVILVIIGILWIIGIYTNTLPVVFG